MDYECKSRNDNTLLTNFLISLHQKKKMKRNINIVFTSPFHHHNMTKKQEMNINDT